MSTHTEVYDHLRELLRNGIPATEAEAEAKMDYLRRIAAGVEAKPSWTLPIDPAVAERIAKEIDEARQAKPVVASTRSDGSTASYYQLPAGATELQDLISFRNMNAQDGEIFRAIYRKGRASHSDELRDARKVLFYAQAEVRRLEQVKTTGWQGVK